MKSRDTITQPLLFERPDNGWRPPSPPELKPGEAVGLDFEYKPGINPTKDQPIGVGIYSPGRKQSWYLPFAHEGGGNLPKEVVLRWLATEMRGRDFYAVNVKAELHQFHNLGLDPDELDLRPHDVAFAAALLNENRYSGFSLEALLEEYLPDSEERKVQPATVDPKRFYLAHAGEVAERCEADCRQHWLLHQAMQPLIIEQGLDKVLALEDAISPAVVDMERNGCLIDRPKLERWSYEVDEKINGYFKRVHDATGLGVNPNAAKDLDRLFNALSLPKPKAFDEQKKEWVQNYSDEALETVDHPVIKDIRLMKQWMSLQSKYFQKYLNAIDSKNVLRFTLHQLRSDSTGEDKGTTTGRFSCGGDRPGEPKRNINVQQVPKCEDQIERLGPDYVVRELFIPQPGQLCVASDASQIEFRLFAHYGNATKVLEAYKQNPMEDFHMLVTKLMKPGLTDPKALKAERKHMKHNNFGVIYGMGREKLARRLGHGCTCSTDWRLRDENNRLVNKFWDNDYHEPSCPARLANSIMDEYHEKFPEAKGLLDTAASRARGVGFVRTLMGRRRRFPDGQRLHKALNAVVQGSAADVFKQKLLELYRARKSLGLTLRAPVHDEFVMDIADRGELPQLQELLDRQSFDLKCPLLWETGTGKNWKEANGQ